MTVTQGPAPVRSLRLVSTLSVAGAVMGLALVSVHRATEPAILAHQERVLQAAIREVLGQPARFETLYVVAGGLSASPPTEPGSGERVHLGFDAQDRPLGFAIAAAEPGFQDQVRLLFGFDPSSGRLLGMKVLESKETPGLGDKIEKDAAFVGQFVGARAPLLGVKPGRGSGEDPREVDLITGATISSRTVVSIINKALERLGPALESYAAEGGP
ncbi:MAG: hypothetical protein DRQ55_16475 [Planctomycetota bacterium]|nr:MAG: hypothetical protein DRQ55_16475 [Planctomycetota bacterium]